MRQRFIFQKRASPIMEDRAKDYSETPNHVEDSEIAIEIEK
jgi:hypothetical protein